MTDIGFTRDTNTMKLTGAAPIFGSGTAYYDTTLVDEKKKSRIFGDDEEAVVRKMTREMDFHVLLKNQSYLHLISVYPNISETKKKNLMDAIKKRNNRITIDYGGFR